MARRVQQIRFYGDTTNKGLNQPASLTGTQMRSGSAFRNYTPMVQLGIQTMPGVKFYLNNAVDPIIVGNTGIYELSVENMTEITALSFDTTAINMINDSPSTAYIIVDILYEQN
jgi:hypothetical protein